MPKINLMRVLLGGVVFGAVLDAGEAVLNGLILSEDWKVAMEALGKSSTMSGGQIAAVNIMGLMLGIFAIWLYAAIRPRYGAGPRTAICAGTAVWFVAYVLGMLSGTIFGMFPMRLALIAVAWGLPEVVLATVAGAWLYKEEATVKSS